ncbi:MAG: hypothetical protein ACT4OS_12490 [Acidimicrobiales bacterium]
MTGVLSATRTTMSPAVPTVAAIGWTVVVAAFAASAAAEAAWGWEGAAMLIGNLAGIVLVASGALLVATQVLLNGRHGGLGSKAVVGSCITAVGALLSFVSWAVVVWTTVMGIGTLLFGAPLLRRGLVPRASGLAVTFALPAASVMSWAGAVFFGTGAEDVSSTVSVLADASVGAAMLILAGGLAGLGRSMSTSATQPVVPAA